MTMFDVLIGWAVFLVPVWIGYPIFMTIIWFLFYRGYESYKAFMRRI